MPEPGQSSRLDWPQFMRVLGHEVNNSLAAIQSLAATFREIAGSETPPADWRRELIDALAGIERRAEGIGRFLGACTELARLPAPQIEPVMVTACVARAVRLTQPRPRLVPGPEVVIRADPHQLEQVLLNLLRNALEAATATAGGVSVGWRVAGPHVEIWVDDEGPGLAPGARPFEPFQTTKPSGSGIGLWLGRQIAEAHGGSLDLMPRGDRSGCRAVLCLPL